MGRFRRGRGRGRESGEGGGRVGKGEGEGKGGGGGGGRGRRGRATKQLRISTACGENFCHNFQSLGRVLMTTLSALLLLSVHFCLCHISQLLTLLQHITQISKYGILPTTGTVNLLFGRSSLPLK